MEHITLNPTVTVGAYSVGDVVGGLLTFTPVKKLETAFIQNVLLIDKANQSSEFDLFLFDEAPTTIADNAAFDLAAGDLEKLIADYMQFTSYVSVNGSSNYVVAKPSAVPAIPVDTQNAFYGFLVARTAPTFANADDLIIRVSMLEYSRVVTSL